MLRAIYRGRDKNTDETHFVFHFDYLNETMKKTAPGRADQVGFYFIGIKRPERAAEISAAIDKTFRNSLAETLTETEKAFPLGFIAMSDAIITAIQLVSFVVIIIILAVVANTMTMSARERTGEYAIFKTLGFGGWYIAALIFGESMVITMIGCAAGIAATFPAKAAFAKSMGNYLSDFQFSDRKQFISIVYCLSLWVSLPASCLPGVL